MAEQDEPIMFANLPGDAQEAIDDEASEQAAALLPPVPDVVKPVVLTGGRVRVQDYPGVIQCS